jgi:hypothetical protein
LIIKQKSFFEKTFLIECLLLFIFPLPFYEKFIVITYTDTQDNIDDYDLLYFLGDWLLIFMFFRLFFMYRSFINYSIYTDAYSKKVCKNYGFTSGVRFSYKCQLENHPGSFVMVLFTSTVLILAYVMRIFEIPYYRTNKDTVETSLFDDYFNSVWLLVMTITTVGYGDLTPNTAMG